jgi:hypothetical protein
MARPHVISPGQPGTTFPLAPRQGGEGWGEGVSVAARDTPLINEVLFNTEGVIEAIGHALKLLPPHPDPLPLRGRGGNKGGYWKPITQEQDAS